MFVCWLISLHLFERACILTETCERALKSGGNRRGRRFCDTTERFFWDRAAYLHFCQLSFQFQCAAQCKYNQHVAAMSLRFHNDEKQFNHENKYFSSGFLNGISVGLEVWIIFYRWWRRSGSTLANQLRWNSRWSLWRWWWSAWVFLSFILCSSMLQSNAHFPLNCGFCSNRILHYFPLSVRLCVCVS